VKKKEPLGCHGYEVISDDKLGSKNHSSKRDPGYETVKESPLFNNHDYETVPGAELESKKVSNVPDYGYEQVENLLRRNNFESVAEQQPRSLPTYQSLYRASEPTPPSLPHPLAMRSISLSPKVDPPPRPAQQSPSAAVSVRGQRFPPPVPSTPNRQTRKSSVTVIELRNEQSSRRNGKEEEEEDDDETVNSGNEGGEIHSHIFV